MKKRSRWTILDVEESVIKTIKMNASKHGYTTATSLKELVKTGIKAQSNQEG